ncbi:hypothetical protein PsorP6_008663 [Peronosclerospora sorghi]|uniref:Uncharacterized protein n=1 Tax=Peronosclerospora sorghi TaxID=230839 RepID=A0ACC0W9H2_9STRA|nr:hypothetical protein PsorP6_008663 [Peronosclerospora sorghi]
MNDDRGFSKWFDEERQFVMIWCHHLDQWTTVLQFAGPLNGWLMIYENCDKLLSRPLSAFSLLRKESTSILEKYGNLATQFHESAYNALLQIMPGVGNAVTSQATGMSSNCASKGPTHGLRWDGGSPEERVVVKMERPTGKY